MSGGTYFLKIFGTGGGDKIKFFVLKFKNRKIAIKGDWNQENIKSNDLLKGILTVNTLTKDFLEF